MSDGFDFVKLIMKGLIMPDLETQPLAHLSKGYLTFPVDEICQRIVIALEALKFDVPGFTVILHAYGGDVTRRFVHYIEGRIDGGRFKIVFGRRQGQYDEDRFASSDVTRIEVPGRQLFMYEFCKTAYLFTQTDGIWSQKKAEAEDMLSLNEWLETNVLAPLSAIAAASKGNGVDQSAETDTLSADDAPAEVQAK